MENDTVSDLSRCPNCDSPVDPGASLKGLCPVCLLAQGVVSTVKGNDAFETGRPGLTPPVRPAHPTRIGPYRVLGLLGEGGMGIVYLAEQESPMRRRVAVKLIKLGMDTDEVLARFESERQALAVLGHPGIAKVYDAGVTEQGRPYFVMEQVAGIPITDYCDRNRLGLRGRLELLIPVCHAVHHAHQKGIIHRDLKPSNILVALEDGRPVPKIIDFGVAKAVNRHLTERTLFTEFGVLLGTPEYMSPEQADLAGLDIDTATDVYSLGVLLYELLVGVLPFDSRRLREVGDHEMRRIIREEDPPRPSERASAGSPRGLAGQPPSGAAEARGTNAETLRRQLRGDLDWIAMRALEKDRTHRYASASEFAADLRRYLNDEPVLAGPPSALYRLRKLIRRRRGPVIVAAAFLLLLLSAVAVSSTLFFRGEQARARALHQAYVANLFAADASLREGEMTEAKRRLLACEPTLRNWEWDHLYARTDTSLAVIEPGTAPGPEIQFFKDLGGGRSTTWLKQLGQTESASFSSDGRRIVWLTPVSVQQADARTFRLVDPRSVRVPVSVPWTNQPEWMVPSVLACSPGGATLLWRTGLPRALPAGIYPHNRPRDYALHLQDAATGRWVAALSGLTSDAVSAVFSLDGRTIAAGSLDGSVLAWDVVSHRVLHRIAVSESPVWLVAVSPASDVIATGADSEVRIHSIATGQLQVKYPVPAGVNNLAFDPRGLRIAAALGDGTVHVRRVMPLPGASEVLLQGHEGGVLSVAFSPDGQRIATGGADKTVRVWDSVTGAVLGIHRGHDRGVNAVAFDVEGKRVVSSSADATIRVWDAWPDASTIAARTLRGHEDEVTSVAFSPDGSRIATAGNDHSMRIWDAGSGQPIQTIPIPERAGWVTVAFAPKARWLAAAGLGMPVILWDAVSHGELRRIPVGRFQELNSEFAFSPDGLRFACATDKIVVVVDARTGSAVAASPPLDEGATGLTYSPDGRLLASGDHNGGIRVWDADKMTPVTSRRGHDAKVGSLAFSPDGKRLVSGSADGTLRVWDGASNVLVGTLRGHDSGVNSVTFSPDGSRIVSGSGDRTLRIWDSQSLELLLTLRGHEARVLSVAFSPDGKRIASGSSDHTVRVWSGPRP